MTIQNGILEPMASRRSQGKGRRGGARKGGGRKGFIPEARRLSVDYPGKDLAALEEIAQERGVSTATVVREAVREYLRARGRK